MRPVCQRRGRARRRDHRFSVRAEWTGHRKQQRVVRFCGAWVGSAPTKSEAWQIAHDWARQNLPSYAANDA
jgi:hypothetical protein